MKRTGAQRRRPAWPLLLFLTTFATALLLSVTFSSRTAAAAEPAPPGGSASGLDRAVDDALSTPLPPPPAPAPAPSDDDHGAPPVPQWKDARLERRTLILPPDAEPVPVGDPPDEPATTAGEGEQAPPAAQPRVPTEPTVPPAPPLTGQAQPPAPPLTGPAHPRFEPIGVDAFEDVATRAQELMEDPEPGTTVEALVSAGLNELDRARRQAALDQVESFEGHLDALETWTVWPWLYGTATGRDFRADATTLLGDPAEAVAGAQAVVDDATARRDHALDRAGTLTWQAVTAPAPGRPWLDNLLPPALTQSGNDGTRPLQSGLLPSFQPSPPEPAPAPPPRAPADCPPAEGPGSVDTMRANCVVETGRHKLTVKGTIAAGALVNAQLRADLEYEVSNVVEDGVPKWRVTVLRGSGGGFGSGVGGVGFDAGEHHAGATGRASADVNAAVHTGATYEFGTPEEALAFEGTLEAAGLRAAGRASVTRSLPFGGELLGRLYDRVVPDPLAGHQPRFEINQAWVSAKLKADLSAGFQGGGFDYAGASVVGARDDTVKGQRTIYARHSQDAWGGLASFGGVAADAAGIARGDVLLAVTLDSTGRPVELTVTVAGSAGSNRSVLGEHDGAGGEARGALRDRSDRIPHFESILGTITRAEGPKAGIVAKLDLADLRNRAAAGAVLASPDDGAPVRALLERIAASGVVYQTSSAWDADVVNVEVGGVGQVRGMGAELLYSFDHDRATGIRVLHAGP